jgi:hypothetical protein
VVVGAAVAGFKPAGTPQAARISTRRRLGGTS